MSQPKALPKWATDATFFPSANPWSGQPIKVEPAAAVKEGGHLPNKRAPATWENWVKNNFAEWLNQLIPTMFTFRRWTHEFTNPHGTTSQAPVPHLINLGARLGLLGNPNGAGLRLHNSLTGYDWNSTEGLIGISNVVDIAAKPSLADGTGGRVVTWDSAGTATRFSTNNGGSWSAGGNVVTGLNSGAYFPLADLFVLAGTNLIYTSPDAATFTSRTPGNANAVARVVAGANECLITGNVATTVQRSTNGTTWASNASPAIFKRLSYNAVHGLWLAHGNDTGRFYTSPDGASWTQVAATTYTISDLVAFGRYWVIALGDGTAALTDDGLTFKKLNIGVHATTSWSKVLVFNDMVILAQRTADDGDTDVFDELDLAFSAQVIGI